MRTRDRIIQKILAVALCVLMAVTLLPTPALAAVDDVFEVSGIAFTRGGTPLEVEFKVLTEDTAASTGTVQVGNGSGPAADMAIVTANIPATVTHGEITYRVTAIGDRAFEQRTELASVSIPDSVTTIGGGAFLGCSSLASVSIPGGVTTIGNDAFNNCRSLASVSIPGSVTGIGSSAFSNCLQLASVYSASPTAPVISNNTFYNIPGTAKLYIPMGASGYEAGLGWPVAAQELREQNPLVSGTVKDSSGAPIAGATVTLDTTPTAKTTKTNAGGHYEFFPVENGSYTVTAAKSGYQDDTASITLNDTNATGTDITLPAINAVTVTGGSGGGNYTEGATVTIAANAPTAGKQFKEWTGADGLTFTDSTSKASATAMFTMPASAVAVTATYEDITPLAYAYNTPTSITQNGVTAAVTYSPASPQAGNTYVTATVTLTGMATAAGTHTVNLTSTQASLAGTAQDITATAGQTSFTVPNTYSFTLSAQAVDDLTLTHTFAAAQVPRRLWMI